MPDTNFYQDTQPIIFDAQAQTETARKTLLSSGALRLETITRLRWGALIGQSGAITIAGYIFNFTFPLLLCFILIGVAAWLNIFLSIRYERTARLGQYAALALFAFDTLQLGGLLFLTGGLNNPFAILIIAPVVTSSTTLSLRQIASLGGLAIAIITALGFFHLPLPLREGTQIEMSLTHIIGIWLAITISIIFITFYVFRVAREASALSQALAATELVLQREQHLQELDGLAAAAAHELGTPLATIALVSRELDALVEHDSPLKEDIALLRSQSQRCRDILKKLSDLSATGEEHIRYVTPSTMLEEIASPLIEIENHIVVKTKIGDEKMSLKESNQPVMVRNPGVFHGIGNILENALDFANNEVIISINWDFNLVSIEILDDGPGFSPENLVQFGEPYMNSRERRKGVGLGLGIFIAKTLLERSGAELQAENIVKNTSAKSARKQQIEVVGAKVSIMWPRKIFESKEIA